MSFDWKSLLKGLAPTVATALGGPLAGLATSALVKSLSPDTDPKDKDAVDKMMQDAVLSGDQVVKIKQIEVDFQVQMATLGFAHTEAIEKFNVQFAQTDAADRDSARTREISVRDYTTRILAYTVTVGFFGLLAFMLTHQVPPENRELLDIMLGSLGGAWVSIVAYYFGSSSGSDRKTELLSKAQPVKE